MGEERRPDRLGQSDRLNISPRSRNDGERRREHDMRVFDKCHFSPSFYGDASRSVQPDLLHAEWDVPGKRRSGVRREKSIEDVEESGRAEGSQKISALIGVREKTDESNRILETAVDKDIQCTLCLLKYLTPWPPVVINLDPLTEI